MKEKDVMCPNCYLLITIRYEPSDSDKDMDVERNVSKDDRYEILKRQKWKCNQCGCVLTFSNKSEWEGQIAHIDHIHPYALRDSYINGRSNINQSANLQALCAKCNLSKGKLIS